MPPGSLQPATPETSLLSTVNPLVAAAVAWCVGTIAGRECPWLWGWTVAAWGMLALLSVFWRSRHEKSALAAALLAVVFIAAAWWNWRVGEGGVWGLRANGESRLAHVEGTVEGESFIRTQAAGDLGKFDFRPPATMFLLNVDRAEGEAGWRPVRAKVVVDSPGYDGRIVSGDRVRCAGWLAPLHSTMNPGEKDRAVPLVAQGVVGRLTLKTAENCKLLTGEKSPVSAWAMWRRQMTAMARQALRHGLDVQRDTASVELIEALLLGDKRGEHEDVYVAFRNAGLAHVLAISGLHLSILILVAWWLLLVATGSPRFAAAGALAAVALYLLVIPSGVAILRSGLMAATACVAMSRGRQVSALAAMCGAAILLLVWRPWDLFTAGFQLSFVVVAGLLLLVPGVSRWMLPDSPLGDPDTRWRTARRFVADSAAVALVGWCVSMPLIAYHFGSVVPIGLISGTLILPLAALALWVGYFKVLLTVLHPALGDPLGYVLWPLGDAMVAMARSMADLPFATVAVAAPTPLWTVASLGVVLALLGGKFAGRWKSAALCLVICLVWLGLPGIAARAESHLSGAALRLHMFAVGDGSCYLVQSGGQTLVYDCGSSNHPDIATASIGPALRALGVTRIGTLVLSHPDTDHYSGVPELADRFAIGRVVTTQVFLDEAERNPDGPAGLVVQRLRERNVPIQTALRGWSEDFGEAELRAIWPPPGVEFEKHNDASLVISIQVAEKSVLLTGDVQQMAIERMLADPAVRADLKADIMELPHHGSMVPASPAFVRAVDPEVVLQSTGPARLYQDAWRDLLAPRTRHVTDRDGAVEVVVYRDGTMESSRYHERGWRTDWSGTPPASYNEVTSPTEVSP